MTSSEVFLYGLLSVVALVYIRKVYLRFSIKHYTASELAEKMSSAKDLVLLDVRTTSERQNAHINGSLHIPLHQLSARMNELRRFNEKEIVCYCQSGNRSLSAAAKLRKNGFAVANLSGGISEWDFSHRG